MNQEKKKALGRYIRRGSRAFDAIKVEKYNFEDVAKHDGIIKDNPGGNIISSHLHEADDIDKCVEKDPEINRDLIDEEQISPIIRPKDFTKEWHEQKKRIKNRSRSFDEDDEDDDFLDELYGEGVDYDNSSDPGNHSEASSDVAENVDNTDSLHVEQADQQSKLMQLQTSEAK